MLVVFYLIAIGVGIITSNPLLALVFMLGITGWGSTTTFSDGTVYPSMIKLSNTSFVVSIGTSSSTNPMGNVYVRIGTISGDTITLGSQSSFSGRRRGLMVRLSDTKFVILLEYRDTYNKYYIYGAVGTVSGTSISFGSQYILDSAYSICFIEGGQYGIQEISSSNFLVSYYYTGAWFGEIFS